MSVYNMAWIFFIYAFLGWCVEVVFQALCHGKFINRGFLCGPVCPIYGFGVLLVVLCLAPLIGHLFILFAASVLITSALEFVTGFILERFFHDKWWDYSDMPLNIKGYVCLHFSLIWGLACVFVMYVIQPLIMKVIGFIPHTAGAALLCIFFVVIIADLIITLAGTLKLRRNLRAAKEIAAKLNTFSDAIGEGLARGALEAREKLDGHKEDIDKIKSVYNDKKEKYDEKAEAKKAEFDRLVEKYKAVISDNGFTARRILRSYPHLVKGKHKEVFENIKKHRQQKKSRRRADKNK